jgi:hypothetical protein
VRREEHVMSLTNNVTPPATYDLHAFPRWRLSYDIYIGTRGGGLKRGTYHEIHSWQRRTLEKKKTPSESEWGGRTENINRNQRVDVQFRFPDSDTEMPNK